MDEGRSKHIRREALRLRQMLQWAKVTRSIVFCCRTTCLSTSSHLWLAVQSLVIGPERRPTISHDAMARAK
ncbi:hypothetical protein LY76DRAFT_590541 [Colletotrichum caudatum]|nr:hypothetical protein LY76DRAFT_590541 [Colletotrichum caudatum]